MIHHRKRDGLPFAFTSEIQNQNSFLGSLYFALYAGMSIEAFRGTVLYVEGQLPEYRDEQKLIDIGLADAPILEAGVKVQF